MILIYFLPFLPFVLRFSVHLVALITGLYRAFCQVAINDVEVTVITIDVLVIDKDSYMWIQHPFFFKRAL